MGGRGCCDSHVHCLSCPSPDVPAPTVGVDGSDQTAAELLQIAASATGIDQLLEKQYGVAVIHYPMPGAKLTLFTSRMQSAREVRMDRCKLLQTF